MCGLKHHRLFGIEICCRGFLDERNDLFGPIETSLSFSLNRPRSLNV